MPHIRRRQFITLLGGAGGRVAGRGDRAARCRAIGVVMPHHPDNPLALLV
jgi:hypothetical protein